MSEDALESMEHFAAHGGLLVAPEDMEALKSVVSELRAAREAVSVMGMEHDEEIKAFNDGLRYVAEKMEEARNG